MIYRDHTYTHLHIYSPCKHIQASFDIVLKDKMVFCPLEHNPDPKHSDSLLCSYRALQFGFNALFRQQSFYRAGPRAGQTCAVSF